MIASGWQARPSKKVEKFEFLGSLLTRSNNCSEEIKRRIEKATGAIASLKHVWGSKLRVFTTWVFSVLLYASETWTLKQIDRRKLLAFEMKHY